MNVPSISTTPEAIRQEFLNNTWEIRLDQCRNQRIDKIVEYEEGEKEYRKRIISRHMENSELIALSITKVFFDGHSTIEYKMLLIDGVRHIVP